MNSLSLESSDWRMVRYLLREESEVLSDQLVSLPEHGIELFLLTALEVIEPTNAMQYGEDYPQNRVFLFSSPG